MWDDVSYHTPPIARRRDFHVVESYVFFRKRSGGTE